MLYPDRLAVLKISHPTPNLLKIIESERAGSLGLIYRDHGRWTIEFPLKENTPSTISHGVASEMTEMFKNQGIDAYSEISGMKLLRRGSTKFNELFDKLSKLNGVIIYPGTIWDYNSLLIFVGIFSNAMENFSDWLQELILDSPVKVELKYLKSANRDFMFSLMDKYLFINKLKIIRYRWQIPEVKLNNNEFSVFNQTWIGSPKYLSNDSTKFICLKDIERSSTNIIETIECDPSESYLIQTDYFIKNRKMTIISLSVKSMGNRKVENELIVYGIDDKMFYNSLFNLWSQNGEVKIPHELTQVVNYTFQQ